MGEILSRLRGIPGHLRTCLSFFTRLPMRPGPGNVGSAAGAWPLAGALAAGLAVLVVLPFASLGMPPFVVATLIVGASIAISGALHEDGLADTADGLGGGHGSIGKLAMMRDSRLGTYGGIALAFSLILRIAALASLALPYGAAAAATVFAAAASRALAVWHWHSLRPARTEGLAHAAGWPDTAAFGVAGATGGLAVLATLIMFGWPALLAAALAAAAAFVLTELCRRQVGGHTGDTIGAAQQVAEAAFLVGLTAGVPYFLR